jgi:omega-6 fatty acid desaturase (delta-12 desaturase)
MLRESSSEPRSLAPVIQTFPQECYDNPTGRGLAYFARDLVIYACTVAALYSTDSLWLLLPLWVLAGLGISALFVLAHDAAHGSLFKNDRLNYWIGQIGMLPSLHIFEMWCYGHNRIHHGHTTREEMDYVWHPTTPAEYRALSPLRKLAHRFKWSAIGGGFYYLWDVWWTKMVRFTPPDKMGDAVRRDRIIVASFAALTGALLLAAGVARYGTLSGGLWMWMKVFGIPFLVWNYSIGITVYVHHIAQDIPWHTRREWNKFRGQMEGTTILHIPRWLNVFYHNIFLHVPHHVDMRIPFYQLPAACEALRKHYGHVVRERVLHPLDYLRTTRTCKLFDFEKGVWCDYRGRQFALETTLL